MLSIALTELFKGMLTNIERINTSTVNRRYIWCSSDPNFLRSYENLDLELPGQ